MPRGPATFKQKDVTRALKATVAAGIDVKRVEIEKDGKIVVVVGRPEAATPDEDQAAPNEWDGAT